MKGATCSSATNIALPSALWPVTTLRTSMPTPSPRPFSDGPPLHPCGVPFPPTRGRGSGRRNVSVRRGPAATGELDY